MREISKTYSDPLDLVWLNAATQIGFKVVRDPEVFASWDGKGTLRIGAPETLDADDSLAQMIFHEICHCLVQGPDSVNFPDWGLNDEGSEDVTAEHACLRLQARLAGEYGLAKFFAATTDFRSFYDQIESDPLSTEDAASKLAQEAYVRATSGPWATPLKEALTATQSIATIVGKVAPADSLWSLAE